MRRFLFKVFGRRVAVLFGGVCFLSVAVLAALYLTAGYAIESYVSDQLRRLPWDITALQRSSIRSYPELKEEYRTLPGLERLETFGMMRIQRGNGSVEMEVDGQPMPARWLAIIAATDPSILPPELRRQGSAAASDQGALRVQAALVTGSRASADPVRVNEGSVLRIFPIPQDDSHAGHTHSHDAAPTISSSEAEEITLEATIAIAPAQIERLEFNKWMLNSVGSLSYLPEHAVVIVVPMEVFQALAPRFEQLFLSSEGVHGGEASPPYLPEVAHLIRLDREHWVSTWDLAGTLDGLSPLLQSVLRQARDVTPFSYVNSDLHRVLTRMADITDLVGLVTLLVAIPLLWLAWVVAKMLSGLLLMNERRLIGLALIRGIPISGISQALMSALVIGGLVGGILGLIAGIALPVFGHALAGQAAPPYDVFARGIIYFPIFIGLGILLALLSGRSMIRRIRRMTPREAMARVASNEFDAEDRPSVAYAIAATVSLLLGGYKIACWIAGRSLLVTALFARLTPEQAQQILLLETLLNFIAIPLFLFGITGILRWRLTWFQRVLNALSAPLVGRLRWFVAEHMALSRHRIASTFFLTALAMSLILLPQVAADTFYDRIMRGVDASVGSDLQLEYSMPDLAGGRDEPAPVPEYNALIQARLAAIEEALLQKPEVTAVAVMQQYIMPGIYLPVQTGLMVNLIEDHEHYLNTVFYEEGLGITRPFSQVVSAASEELLTASQGFLRVRKVPMQSDIILGYTDDYEAIPAQFGDVLAFLPGQPSIDTAQREGYVAAEVDYLNYVMSSDARVFSALDRFERAPLSQLKVLPSRAVFLVNVNGAVGSDDVDKILRDLPDRPQEVRWRAAEQEKVGKDMFISLALGNMKVFMIGGLVLAVAGVFVVGLANFIAERRTFSLLRLRGLPRDLLLRVSLSMFLVPVVVGILLGSLLGAISGFGVAQAIWELPRIYGVAGFLANQLNFTAGAWAIVFGFGAVLTIVAVGFGIWPFRKTAREAIKEG